MDRLSIFQEQALKCREGRFRQWLPSSQALQLQFLGFMRSFRQVSSPFPWSWSGDCGLRRLRVPSMRFLPSGLLSVAR